MRKICVIGGGNLAHFIVAKLGQENEVSVYTRRADEWKNEIEAVDISGARTVGKVKKTSDDAGRVLSQVEIVFITWPTNILHERICEIEPYITENMWVCFCPGYGGKEFICSSMAEKGTHIMGTQRVFSSTKVLEYGKSVSCIDNRPAIHMGTLRKEDLKEGCNILFELFHKKCIAYDNYLNIALTPSNPVLHTSRLYSLFKDYDEDTYYTRRMSFYSEWDDDSSEVLLRYDEEVQGICRELDDMRLDGVKSLRKHYEIADVEGCGSDIERMTKKIRSLKFLKDQAPMIETERGFIPDFNARYFQEDFMFGLYVLRNYAVVLGSNTKQMDEIIAWYKKVVGERIAESNNRALPLNNGILTPENIKEFYLQ